MHPSAELFSTSDKVVESTNPTPEPKVSERLPAVDAKAEPPIDLNVRPSAVTMLIHRTEPLPISSIRKELKTLQNHLNPPWQNTFLSKRIPKYSFSPASRKPKSANKVVKPASNRMPKTIKINPDRLYRILNSPQKGVEEMINITQRPESCLYSQSLYSTRVLEGGLLHSKTLLKSESLLGSGTGLKKSSSVSELGLNDITFNRLIPGSPRWEAEELRKSDAVRVAQEMRKSV